MEVMKCAVEIGKGLVAVLVILMVSGCAKEEMPVAAYRPRPTIVQTDPTGRFTKGDSMDKVRSVMGPAEISNELPNGDEIWSYKFSSVTFRRGKVMSWNDMSRVLRTRGTGGTTDEIEKKSGVAMTDGPLMPAGFSGVANAGGGKASDSRFVNPNQIQVREYQKADGTFVPSHIRTRGNSTTSDNLRRR